MTELQRLHDENMKLYSLLGECEELLAIICGLDRYCRKDIENLQLKVSKALYKDD